MRVMALQTLVARVSDGLPLSASIQDDEQSGRNLTEFQTQAKQIFRKLTLQSPSKCSIESPPLVFHYIIENGVCYLALCEPSYPPRLAFSYLEAIQVEFSQQYTHDIHKAQRPYHFIEFGAEINRIKKSHQEASSRRGPQPSHLRGLHDELQGVQRIMFENVDAVLRRGELVSELSTKANYLASSSSAYRKEAHFLNLKASLATKIAIALVIFLLLIFLRYLVF